MPDSMFGAKANPTREICKRLAFKEHARDCVKLGHHADLAAAGPHTPGFLTVVFAGFPG